MRKTPLAAGALYPAFDFRPEMAGLALALSSVTVVTLSLWLKKYIPPAKMIGRGEWHGNRPGMQDDGR